MKIKTHTLYFSALILVINQEGKNKVASLKNPSNNIKWFCLIQSGGLGIKVVSIKCNSSTIK